MKRNSINMPRKYKIFLMMVFCCDLIELSSVHAMITCEEAKNICLVNAENNKGQEQMCSAFSQLLQIRLNHLRGGSPTPDQLWEALNDTNNSRTLLECAKENDCVEPTEFCKQRKKSACEKAGNQCPIDYDQLSK